MKKGVVTDHEPLGSSSLCEERLVNAAPCLHIEREDTDHVESSSLDAKGVCKDVDVFVDDMLRLEQRRIFVVDIPKRRVSVAVWCDLYTSHLFEITSSLHSAS